jgi:hypothetical protein
MDSPWLLLIYTVPAEPSEGQASLVTGASLDRARAEAVVEQFKTARAEEYAEIAGEAERLRQHIARETEHRDFSFAELEELEEDLAKARRWMDQVQSRDDFPDGSHLRAQRLLADRDEALAEFLETAAAQDSSA